METFHRLTQASITLGIYRSLIAGLQMRQPAELTYFAFGVRWAMNAFAAGVRRRRGLHLAAIFIADNVVVRSRLQQEPCLSVHASPYELGFRRYGS